MKVLKFGGTSVASATNIKLVKDIVSNQRSTDPLVVVVSALGGITNQLTRLTGLAVQDTPAAKKLINEICASHLEVIEELLTGKQQAEARLFVEEKCAFLQETIQGIRILGEATPRVNDKIMAVGEQLSSYIIHAFFSGHFPCELLDPTQYIITDNNFGQAQLLHQETWQRLGKLALSTDTVYLSPGFIGATASGELTTLGRGGSDFSAAIFARGLKANELQIWTDVSGMMTADPNMVKQARVISELSYEEAMELSHFGAKVIYPPAIQPVLQAGIPIRIKNTFHPAEEGTLIQKEAGNHKVVQGITSISGITLLNLKGSGMVGVPTISHRLFASLSRANINVVLITQASSEHTITVGISTADRSRACTAINEEFNLEMAAGRIDALETEDDLAIVAVIGSSMRHQVGVSGKMFSSLAANGINIKAIAQGSSERNISVVIEARHLKKALNSLHEDFFLSTIKRLHLFIIGTGNVGQAFLSQVNQQADKLYHTEGIDIKVAGLANSKKMIFAEEGITLDNWQTRLADGEAMQPATFIEKMFSLNLRNSIFIDNTASEEITRLYEQVLHHSIAVVTPNKIAASADYTFYKNLKQTAQRYRTRFLFETNVGAGLPVISTLNNLVQSGDEILAIEAVLSGSLNFIFNNYDGSRPFADIVRQARDEGYTEPDPRLDLSGLDVKRKLLILMREAGVACNITDLRSESFLPAACETAASVNDFLQALEKHEAHFQQLYAASAAAGKQLKYTARYQHGAGVTGLQAIAPGHPFYDLQGKDNIVLFYTRRYPEQPLLVRGAGAGAEVTASGIFADVLLMAHAKPTC